MATTPDTLLPGPAVQERFGVTSMSIYRWRKNPNLGFPAPLSINGRNYWRAADLAAWQTKLADAGRVVQ